jgi:endonuclease-3
MPVPTIDRANAAPTPAMPVTAAIDRANAAPTRDAEPRHEQPAAIDRATRAVRIQTILDELYPTPDSPLAHETPFQLLVATILSAQCTDARVNMVTPKLFAVAPDAHTMATLKPRDVLKLIKTCGLAKSKATNIVAMSKALVATHGGEVPPEFASLEQLAGVGHKTAGVVMAQAFGVPAFPVDTHIHRLAARWQLSRGTTVEATEADLKAVFPEQRWNALHLQIIYFGRSHCIARGHVPERCPICSWAMSKARAEREARAERASMRQRKATVRRNAAAKRKAVALAKRSAGSTRAGSSKRASSRVSSPKRSRSKHDSKR